MASTEVFGLQWLEHPNIFNQAIIGLRNKGSFTDATLACEGKFYPVHKFVLSTCSEYFNAIFEWTPCVNPVVVINNISTQHLEPLLDFMYRGETNVQECYIQDVMKAAECLHIKGLSLRSEEALLAKSRTRSPQSSDDPRKKRKRSEGASNRKKASFLKPQHQQQQQTEDAYSKTEASPLHTSSTIPPPTPPPTTPVHHPSPHHTPPVHSPSLHSASPITLSSAASSPSGQTQFQSAPLQTTSPKSILTPAVNLANPIPSHQVKNISPFSEVSAGNASQSQSVPHSVEVYSPHSRDHFSGLKEEQPSMGLTSLTSVVPSSRDTSVLSLSQAQEAAQFRRCHGAISERIMSEDSIHQNVVQGGTPALGNLEQKIIGIGEELHLEGPVKELEIATEDGTVSIPEILEGLVDMRQLYDSKNDSFSHDSKASGMEILPQCSTGTAQTSTSLLSFKEETNESMYEFTEDFQEDSGIDRMKLLKEKTHKVYSNNGTNMKRKHASDQGDLPPSLSPKLPGNGETSRCAAPSTSPSPPSLSQLSGNIREEAKPQSFVCGTCSRVCKKKDSLTRHMRTHMEFPYTCTVCFHKCKMYKEFIIHRKTHATKRCDKCDFVTIRNDNLRRHMITHSEEKSHKCPYPECSYSTSRANLLSSHVQNNHTKKAKKEEK